VSNPHDFGEPVQAPIPPRNGEAITSLATGMTYTIGDVIGEGAFGVVFGCTDGWENDLAAKVLKPTRSHDEMHAAAVGELERLRALRHPSVTYVYDAFEFQGLFYIITERCYCPVSRLFSTDQFDGSVWIRPLARCLLQAVHYLHVNQYAHQDIHSNNVFAAFARDEMDDTAGAITFKLGDLGISKVFGELDAANTLADWMRPPEAIDPAEYGQLDHRIDIYHAGLLFLQLAYSSELRFSRDEVIAGVPREMALSLPAPLNFALEKALRRHVAYRTASAPELWRDLCSPGLPDTPPEELAEVLADELHSDGAVERENPTG
jgi:serine/threonine-protein kinase